MLLNPQKKLKDYVLDILGDSGTSRYSGYFSEEPQIQWREQDRITNVETMRRTDATVEQFLTALKTPMLAAEYYLEAANDTPQAEEQKEFLEQNLFGMERTFKEFLRELLTYLDFGFCAFELIFTIKDGKIWLKDLAPRIQASIQSWQLTDGRRGVVQYIRTDEVNYSVAEIPMNKLLVLTNSKEGDDLTGRSVLRPCWKHFQIKDRLYRVSAISAERYGVGVPIITLPEGASDTEKEDAENLGANLRSNEKGYIVLPSKDWVIDILVPKGNPQQSSIENQIQHHDRMILSAGLLGFLNLGSDSTGSYALSKDQSSFFLKHCEDKLLYICEQICIQVGKRLIDLNFGEQEKYPKLKFTPLGDIDFAEYSSTLNTLVQAGLVSEISSKDVQFVRKTFKMPELSQEEMTEIDQKKIDDELAAMEAEEIVVEETEDNMDMEGENDSDLDVSEEDEADDVEEEN